MDHADKSVCVKAYLHIRVLPDILRSLNEHVRADGRLAVAAEYRVRAAGLIEFLVCIHDLLEGRLVLQPQAAVILHGIGVVPQAEHAVAGTAVSYVNIHLTVEFVKYSH